MNHVVWDQTDRARLAIVLAIAATVTGVLAATRLDSDGIQDLALGGLLAFLTSSFVSGHRAEWNASLLTVGGVGIAAGLSIASNAFALSRPVVDALILLALAIALGVALGRTQLTLLIPGCALALVAVLAALAFVEIPDTAPSVAILSAVSASLAVTCSLSGLEHPFGTGTPTAICFAAAGALLAIVAVSDLRIWSTTSILIVGGAIFLAQLLHNPVDSARATLSIDMPPAMAAAIALVTGGGCLVASAVGGAPFGWPVVGGVAAGLIGLGALTGETVIAHRAQSARLDRAMAESRLDGLTGLLNRRGIDDRLESEIARAVRYDHPLSVLLIDIDDFKLINDRFGHAAGDDTLRSIARTVEESIRSIDIAGRLGGEEFLIVLPETEETGAMVVAERIRGSVERTGTATVSLGLSELRVGDRADALLHRADTALYDAKRAGKNRVSGSF